MYLIHEKTQTAINSNLFDHVNNSLYENELVKTPSEHKKPIIVGFLIVQYSKFWVFQLHYKFFTKFFDVNRFEEFEMDTDSLYLALAEKELEDCIRPEKKREWEKLWSEDCTGSFSADVVKRPAQEKKHDKRDAGLFKEEFRCLQMLCLCCKIYCCCDKTCINLKLSSEGLKRRVL